MTSFLPTLASGFVFGSAITASGIAIPALITDQLTLHDHHLLSNFTTAGACSALIVYLARRSNYASFSARSDSTLGWVGRYDANVIGGVLQGIGIALTGAEPGGLLVQAVLGRKAAWDIIMGGILGGVALVGLQSTLKTDEAKRSPPVVKTLSDLEGMNDGASLVIYEAVCLLAISVMRSRTPLPTRMLDPVVGGLLIAGAQASSVLLTRKTIGVSSVYEEIGKTLRSVVNGTQSPLDAIKSLITSSSTMFSTGIMAGAVVYSNYLSAWNQYALNTAMAGSTEPTRAIAVVGGAVMMFGARLAGGCTSGHGISGTATLSISSFITVASILAGGAATGLLLRR